jgi:hypothetical protein
MPGDGRRIYNIKTQVPWERPNKERKIDILGIPIWACEWPNKGRKFDILGNTIYGNGHVSDQVERSMNGIQQKLLQNGMCIL